MLDKIMGVHAAALAAFLLVASTGRLTVMAGLLWFGICAAADAAGIAAVVSVQRRQARRGIR